HRHGQGAEPGPGHDRAHAAAGAERERRLGPAMTSRDGSTHDLVRSLLRRQLKHKKLLLKVEKTTARLQRREAKLHALESRIAELERNLADASDGHAPGNGESPRKRAQL